MLTLLPFLALSTALFGLAAVGLSIHRNNLIQLLMCMELMLLAVNTNFVVFSRFLNQSTGEIFVFFILTVAAAEAAIGLAILVLLFKERHTIEVSALHQLKG